MYQDLKWLLCTEKQNYLNSFQDFFKLISDTDTSLITSMLYCSSVNNDSSAMANKQNYRNSFQGLPSQFCFDTDDLIRFVLYCSVNKIDSHVFKS